LIRGQSIAPDEIGGLLQLLEAAVDETILQPRHDHEVRHAERAGNDEQERDHEATPDAAKRVHRSRNR
jgi:hypothetical protein